MRLAWLATDRSGKALQVFKTSTGAGNHRLTGKIAARVRQTAATTLVERIPRPTREIGEMIKVIQREN
jgi:hypothetical protein